MLAEAELRLISHLTGSARAAAEVYPLFSTIPCRGAAPLDRLKILRHAGRLYLACEETFHGEDSRLCEQLRIWELNAVVATLAGMDAPHNVTIQALRNFQHGCIEYLLGSAEKALRRFKAASRLAPERIAYRIAQAIALDTRATKEEAALFNTALVEELPATPEFAPAHAFSLLLRGSALNACESPDAAEPLSAAMPLYERLARLNEPDWMPLAADASLELAIARSWLDKKQDADRWFVRAIDSYSALADEEPKMFAYSLAVAQRARAGYLAPIDIGESEHICEQALESVDQAARLAPGLGKARVEFYCDYLKVVQRSGDAELLQQAYLQAIRATEECRDTHPEWSARQQASLLSELGSLYEADNDSRSATRAWLHATRLLEERSDTTVSGQWLLAQIRSKVGETFLASDLYRDAAWQFEQAIALCNDLSECDNGVPNTLVGPVRARARAGMARALMSPGPTAQREQLLREAIGEMREAFPSSPEKMFHLLSGIEGELLAIFANERRFDDAAVIIEDSMAFLRPWAEKHPRRFGDAYGVQAKYLIRVYETLKKDRDAIRGVAREAAKVVRNPVFVMAFEQIAETDVEPARLI